MYLQRLIMVIVLAGSAYGIHQATLRSWNSYPPFAAVFSPTDGLLRQTPTVRAQTNEILHFSGLTKPVEVRFDERAIPHIEAAVDADLYRAQGYIVARERLFEMDVTSRSALGRLAELFGRKAVAKDIEMRQLGLTQAARTLQKNMENDPPTLEMINAYTEGVNAWIDEIGRSPQNKPMEYWLSNNDPEKWTTLKTAAIIRLMAWRMSGSELASELKRTRARSELGDEAFQRIFSPKLITPALYTGWRQESLSNPDSDDLAPALGAYQLSLGELPSPLNGSNSWTIDGSRTASGYPLIASDPHLNLHLPSIWYEQHLQSPNQNVYGVSVPGVPAILIGFNSHVAWGITNSGMDALDLYRIKFASPLDSNNYQFGAESRPIKTFEEIIHVKGSAEIALSTYWSEHGPLLASQGGSDNTKENRTWLAMHWTGHFPANEPGALRKLNRLQNCEHLPESLDEFVAPLLNFTCADREGNIGVFLAGKVPMRKNNGQFVSDGTAPEALWTSFVPTAHMPASLNPSQHFLVSANQHPSHPVPDLLKGNFANSERSGQIHDQLEAPGQWTVDKARSLQTDSRGRAAEILQPRILKVLQEIAAPDPLDDKILAILRAWDYQYLAQSAAPTIFEGIFLELETGLWSSLLNHANWREIYPRIDRQTTWEELRSRDQPAKGPINEQSASQPSSQLIQEAYARAKAQLLQKYGDQPAQWTWGAARSSHLSHLLKVDSLGWQHRLPSPGSPDTINALHVDHGPSWRMVVEMTPKGPFAFGVYPGGQSGNPGSPEYTQFIDAWIQGELYPLHFEKDRSMPSKAQSTLPIPSHEKG